MAMVVIGQAERENGHVCRVNMCVCDRVNVCVPLWRTSASSGFRGAFFSLNGRWGIGIKNGVLIREHKSGSISTFLLQLLSA